MRNLVLTACLLTVQAIGLGQDVAKLGLNNNISLLNDRVWLSCPDSAKDVARGHGIMSAPHNNEDETRIIHDLGDKRLVIFAQEMLLVSSGDLFTDIQTSYKSEDGTEPYTHTPLKTAETIVAVLSTPKEHDKNQEAILVNSLMVKTQSGALIRIGAYINPAAFDEREAYTELTRRIFQTITKGERNLVLASRQHTSPMMWSKKDLVVDIPDAHVFMKDIGPDFAVHKIKLVADFNSDDFGQLILYEGHHPASHYSSMGFEDEHGTTVPGSFLGEKNMWVKYQKEGEDLVLIEKMFTTKEMEKDVYLHLVIVSNNPKEVDALIKVAGSLKIE